MRAHSHTGMEYGNEEASIVLCFYNGIEYGNEEASTVYNGMEYGNEMVNTLGCMSAFCHNRSRTILKCCFAHRSLNIACSQLADCECEWLVLV